MINSPSLSVVSPVAKPAKASSQVSSSNQSKDNTFGVALNDARKTEETSSRRISDESSDKTAIDDKSVSDQRSEPVSAKEKQMASTTESKVPEHATKNSSSNDNPVETDTPKNTSQDAQSYSNEFTEETTSSLENGNERQVDGQELAVNQKVVTVESEALKNSEHVLDGSSSPDKDNIDNETPTDSVVVKASAEFESKQSTGKGKLDREDEAALSASSDQAIDTNITNLQGQPNLKDAKLKSEEVGVKTNETIKSDDGLTQNVEANLASNNRVEIDQAENVSPISSSTGVEEGVEVSDESQLIASSGENENAEKSDGEILVQVEPSDEVKQTVSVDQIAAVSTPSSLERNTVQTTSMSDTSEVAVDLNANKGNENLRWVLEQMSKKVEQAPIAAPTSLGMDSDVLETPFMDENMVDLLSDGAIELTEEFSEILGPKKNLDQLMANLSNQLQQNPVSAQGINTATSTLNPNAMARPEGSAAQLTMQNMPTSTAWPAEMASKVSWVAKEGFQTAHIQLDPPELGSLTVKVSIDQDSNTHVSFVASSAQAKDALEGQMQRLRDMLQQQGVDLDSVDVEVSQNNGQAFGSNGSEDGQGSESGRGGLADNGELDDEPGLDNVSYIQPAEQGIDYYA